jgi:putative membrane protein
MKKTTFTLALLSTALLLAVSCATQHQQAALNETRAMTSSGLESLTDVEAGAIAHTLNDGEIMLARMAVANATNPAVRDFAQMMITDHTNANAMLEREGYAAAPNSAVNALNTQVDHMRNMLQSSSGPAFDRTYIAQQIDMHQNALAMVGKNLQPSAQDPDLRNILGNMRSTVEMHLQHAKTLQNQVGR